MSEKNIQSISVATTGQFPSLSVPAIESGGMNPPGTGNTLPASEAKRPDIIQLAANLNTASQKLGRELRFEVNLGSKRAVIQVLDSETGEVIRQIPPEKAEVYLSGGGELALRLIDANA